MNPIQIQKVHTLTGHKDCLYTLAKMDDRRFFSAGADGMVVLWDLQAPDTGHMLTKIPASVYAMDYYAPKGILVVGQNFSGVHLIDVSAKKEVASLALTSAAIFDIKATKDCIYVATGDGKVTAVGWDLSILNTVSYAQKSARSIAVNPDRKEIAVGYSDNFIRILNEELQVLHEIPAHDISVFSVCYHPEKDWLISVSRDARIKLWNARDSYTLVEEVAAHMYAINHVAFSPDGNLFATCSMDKSIKLWDAHQMKLLKVIDKMRHAGHGTSVNKLLWSNFNNWLVSCSDDRTISVWQINMTTN